MNICIICSARDLPEHYVRDARQLTLALSRRGHTLIWGGTDTGLMKVVADAAREGGGRIIGVSLALWDDVTREDADEMIVAQTLPERKALMFGRADAIVMLAGGIGTFDEATEIIELRRQGVHLKPIIVLNTAGFYDGFSAQLARMEAEGFLSDPVTSYVAFAPDPTHAIALLDRHVAPGTTRA